MLMQFLLAAFWMINVSLLTAQTDSKYLGGAGSGYAMAQSMMEVLAIDDGKQPALPERFTLEQNFPNPFNPSTSIRFGLPGATRAELAVYNLSGQRIVILAQGLLQAGQYSISWHAIAKSGKPLATGVYLLRLSAAKQVLTRKMLLVR